MVNEVTFILTILICCSIEFLVLPAVALAVLINHAFNAIEVCMDLDNLTSFA